MAQHIDRKRESLYFIAIVPPSPVLEEALALKEYFHEHYQSKASLNSPPHITLHMPFQWKDSKEELLIQSLNVFAKTQTSFEIALQNFNCFQPRVIYIDVAQNEPLSTLQYELHRFLKKELTIFNANYKDQPFHPHITLAFRDLRKQNFYTAWEEFKSKIYSASFTVDSISLLKYNGKVWEAVNKFDLAANSQ
jgi:2'-5' RNA ligase